eukprot:SAG22_NODE_5_length_41775_cov_111.520971_3_plen_438_part_00
MMAMRFAAPSPRGALLALARPRCTAGPPTPSSPPPPPFRAGRVIVGGAAGVVLLGGGGAFAAQHFLQQSEVQGGGQVGATWPLAVIAVGTVGLGAGAGVGIGIRQFGKAPKALENMSPAELAALQREGATLGLRALGVATLVVAGGGAVLLGSLAVGIGVETFVEFDNVMAGRPKDFRPADTQLAPAGAEENDLVGEWLGSGNAAGVGQRSDTVGGRLRLDQRGGLHMVVDRFSRGGAAAADDGTARRPSDVIVLLHDTTPTADRSSAVAAVGGDEGLDQLLAAAAATTVVSYDQRGHGQSTTSVQRQAQLWRWVSSSGTVPPAAGVGDGGNGGLPPEDAAERAVDLLAVLEGLEIDDAAPVHAVCIGGSAAIAAELAARAPTRVASIVLVAPPPRMPANINHTAVLGGSGSLLQLSGEEEDVAARIRTFVSRTRRS